MQPLITLFLLILSFPALAKPYNLVEVRFEKGKAVHLYALEANAVKQKTEYTLIFKSNKGISKKKPLSIQQAEQIQNEASHIIFENDLRRPAANCKVYAVIQAGIDKAQICEQNRISTARSFGFLNLLDRVTK